MKKIWIAVLFFLFSIEANTNLRFDPTFSQRIKEMHQEYFQREGDWCDQLCHKVQKIEKKYERSVTFQELAEEGVDADFLDAMALEYCKKHKDAYLAIVWPTLDASYEKVVHEILSKECIVAYKKTFVLYNNGPKTLMHAIPEKVPHIPYDFQNYFAPGKTSYELRCFVFRAPDLASTVRAKRVLRNLVKLDPYCMHINDTHEQMLDLAFLLLNNNSLHYLNFHKVNRFDTFNFLCQLYTEFLENRSIPKRDVCVDGSAVLSLYGLRDCALDFDFLCTKFSHLENIHPLDHHNCAWEKLNLPIDEVIYNPKNFLYYRGHKFASLQKIRDFKALQGRVNDLNDVAMVDDHLKHFSL